MSLTCLRAGALQLLRTPQLGNRVWLVDLRKMALCHGQTEAKVGDRATAPANEGSSKIGSPDGRLRRNQQPQQSKDIAC